MAIAGALRLAAKHRRDAEYVIIISKEHKIFIQNFIVTVKQQLKQEIAALQHELRRVHDALERNPTHDLQRREQQLAQNIALCEHQLQQTTFDRNSEIPRTR